MPYTSCTLLSVQPKKEDVVDTEGNKTTKVTYHVRAKISCEDIRPGGFQLYSILSILYLPLIFDLLWVYFTGAIKPISGLSEYSVRFMAIMSMFSWDNFNSSISAKMFIIFCFIPVVIVPYFFQSFLVGFNVIFGALSSLVFKLYYALTCKNVFSNSFLGLECRDDASNEGGYEISIHLDEENVLLNGFEFIADRKPGDILNVGFGPIEYICLFRDRIEEPGKENTSLQIANVEEVSP